MFHHSSVKPTGEKLTPRPKWPSPTNLDCIRPGGAHKAPTPLTVPVAEKQKRSPVVISGEVSEDAIHGLENMARYGGFVSKEDIVKFIARYSAQAGVDFHDVYGIIMVETGGRSGTEWFGQAFCESAVPVCSSKGLSNLQWDAFKTTVDAYPYLLDGLDTNNGSVSLEDIHRGLIYRPELAIAVTAFRLKWLKGLAAQYQPDSSDADLSTYAVALFVGIDKNDPNKNAINNGKKLGTIARNGTLAGRPADYVGWVRAKHPEADLIFCSRGSGFTCGTKEL